MAADDLSIVNLPPITSTGNASPRRSRQENGEKEKDKNKNSKQDQQHPRLKPAQSARNKAKTDIDFEPPEHELDSFA